eukprot:403350754
MKASNINLSNQSSKKRKLAQTTISSMFSQNSQNQSKRLKTNVVENKEDDLIDITVQANLCISETVNPKSTTGQKSKSKPIQASIEEEKKESSANNKPSKALKSKTLQDLFTFNYEDIKTVQEYRALFDEIADLLLNHYVLTVNHHYKYRIAEIEFYFNDIHSGKVHPDTFTHGDDLQTQIGQWYFHRFGKTFKVGTYKGMDLSFGKGAKAFGGILIRAISSLGATDGKQLPPNEFIEGPCNSVNRILQHNSTEQLTLKEVKEFVVLDGFNLDALTKNTRLYLSHLEDEENKPFQKLLQTLKVYKCPRVGLTLKRFDEQKCEYWMADYRFLTYPHLHKKYANFIHMCMLKDGMDVDQVVKACKAQRKGVEEIEKQFRLALKDDKKRVSGYKTVENMKNGDFAYVYGLHQKGQYV